MKRLIATLMCFMALGTVEAHATGYCTISTLFVDGRSITCTTCCFYESCTTTCT